MREEVQVEELMEQYEDTPMNFADASVVAAAEALRIERVFTTDSDFHVYRLYGNQPFEVVP